MDAQTEIVPLTKYTDGLTAGGTKDVGVAKFE